MISIYKKSRRFFTERHERTQHGAKRIASSVADVMGAPPARVIDVGCGVGTFLDAFKELGAETIRGLEGSWLDPDHLVIERSELTPHDLQGPLPDLGAFDLVICLEVAEHLTPERADSFVEDLSRYAPAILFSAAIPLQGGVGHLNEQWPSWWADRFSTHGFLSSDCIRPLIWSDDAIGTWYRQNTILYLREGHPALAHVDVVTDRASLDLVHPAMYLDKTPGNSIPKAAKALRRATKRSIVAGFRSVFSPGGEGS